MSRTSPASAGVIKHAVRRTSRSRSIGSGRRPTAITGRCLALVAVVTAAIAVSASPAMALSASHNVALIPSAQPFPPEGIPGSVPDGVLPTSTTVAGKPNESFDNFVFTNVALSQVTSAGLSKFDTVVLNQVKTRSMSPAVKAALAQFIANGGKLLIHDADGTNSNDYSFLSPSQGATQVGAGCPNCGKTVSTLPTITANSGLISANPADASYVNLADLNNFTDAMGDSNLLNSTQQDWRAVVKGQNANGEQGAELAYETTRGNGLAVYNGFDTDMIMPTASSQWRCVLSPQTQYVCKPGAPHAQADWLAQMWYNELIQSWGPSTGGGGSGPGSGLPKTTPVSTIGTPVPPSQAGLPPAKACVAKRSLFLRLKNLLRHHKLSEIDVYVNGHRVVRERGHWHNVTLRHLPKKGKVNIKIVATTKRHFHLISRQSYHAC